MTKAANGRDPFWLVETGPDSRADENRSPKDVGCRRDVSEADMLVFGESEDVDKENGLVFWTSSEVPCPE